ncbi:NINE protein [soil metagenome]
MSTLPTASAGASTAASTISTAEATLQAADAGYRSKTLATWLALIGGSIGLHRFYLHGFKDAWGWLYAVPTLVGIYGVQRMLEYGQDDQLAWALLPLLGLSLSASMLTAIVYGLKPDDKWNARFNAGGRQHQTGWLTIFGVVIALLVGAGVLMATIAFSGQRYFEYQIEEAHKISQQP